MSDHSVHQQKIRIAELEMRVDRLEMELKAADAEVAHLKSCADLVNDISDYNNRVSLF